MAHNDLRSWLEAVDSHGELAKLSKADCNLEMPAIAEILTRETDTRPAILFGDIPGYAKGCRALFGMLNSARRIAITLGLSDDITDNTSLVQSWRTKLKNIRPTPPKLIDTGPVLNNTLTDKNIDLLKFPVPLFSELDGGRYIGTGAAIIQKDPDEGWVNVGTYRVMLVDANRLVFHVNPGQHGRLIMEKYFSQGRVMPIAIVAGIDHPLLYWAGGTTLPVLGDSEYDYVGGIRGEPVEVIEGPLTGLPVPAHAEIVIEGECCPGEEFNEGPFGEWHGYYANAGLRKVPAPLIRVKAIHFRDDPILTCAHVSVPPNDQSLQQAINHSAAVWNNLEESGISGIRGVWCHEIGAGSLFNVISLKQMYTGHAQKAGIIASQNVSLTINRYTVVVDDDIDPFNLEEVLWAVVTRAPAEESIQILKHCRGIAADPAIPLAEKLKYRSEPKPLYGSQVVVNGCQPFEHKADWYPVVRISAELRDRVLKKWSPVLSQYLKPHSDER